MTETAPLSAPPRLSMTAAASLVCGLLGWSILTAPIAIFTGIIGLRATRNPNVRGRGMAMAGLILGTIFGVVGVGLGLVAYRAYNWGIDQVATRLPIVLNAAVDDKPADAKDFTALSPTATADLRQRMAGWGRVDSVHSIGMTFDRVEGQPNQMKLAGVANFEQAGSKPFEVIIDADNDWVRIVDVKFK